MAIYPVEWHQQYLGLYSSSFRKALEFFTEAINVYKEYKEYDNKMNGNSTRFIKQPEPGLAGQAGDIAIPAKPDNLI